MKSNKKNNRRIPLTPAMEELMERLEIIVDNPLVEAAYNDAIAHVRPILYPGAQKVTGQDKNPWIGRPISYFVEYFRNWFTFLAQPAGGLGEIVPFTYFYLDNPQAYYFLNQFESRSGDATQHTKEIFNWTVAFVKERGNFMDSEASAEYIPEWERYLGKDLENYVLFNSFAIWKISLG